MTDNLQEKPIDAALPCPFCGSHDVQVVEGSTFRWLLVQCNCCAACGPDVRKQTAGSGTNEDWQRNGERAAIAEWNRRAPPSPK